MRSYPCEVSGGMKQRSMIVIAKKEPLTAALLILNKATTAFNLTIQTQILALAN